MMLTCIYHMIQTGEAFNPSDLQATCKPEHKKQSFTDETAIAFLAAQGYDVSSLSKVSSATESMVIDSSLKSAV